MPEKHDSKAAAKAKSSPKEEEVRIGAYTCYCGGNISDVVYCEKVAEALAKLPNVVVSRTDMSMCSDAGQAKIEEDIREHGVNRVVVGACAPSLHEQTFRGTVQRAGLNPFFYHHVGLREQDSWVHHDRVAATKKAIRLMSAGIAKARLLEPLEHIRLSAEKHALVIGGGIAGLRAARDISRRGLKVTLIERSPFLGGHMAQLESIFPTEEDARTVLHGLIEEVAADPNITLYTSSELTGVRGYVGDYQVQITQQSRGVDEDVAEEAMAACTLEVPDDYNYGLTQRKVIYKAYPGCYPPTPAVDWKNIPDGKLELKMNGKKIKLENKPKTIDVKVGAIVIATGFTPYEPRKGEYGYGELPEVVTMPQFIRLLAMAPKGEELVINEKPVRNIGFIHCVGSRQIDDVHEPQPDGEVNNYCSRVCCTATLHLANDLRHRFPDLNIFDVYEDIRTYGRGHEDYYIEASENRVVFLRFHGEEPPEVVASPDDDVSPVQIKLKDYLTWGEEVEVPADLIVLAVGIMPNPVDDLINLLKVSPGTDRFLLEVHPKLRPVETAVPGIVLAGTAQGPMTIQESCAAASAAAAKVSVLLSQGLVELEPYVARVDLDLCKGSGECVEVCAYEDAITLESMTIGGKEVKRAVVSPANCAGCGACVSACPNRAIDLQGWTLGQYQSMIEAIVAEIPAVEIES
ncbi:MAG TPA: CoB--CoM heterodisulfide reductase iron-sulfur subunit A family protein [Anaerolineae bacterium]|nr:CoB--CoM heterodisulfide reductase iron-sulfur subunit A family protein [Anaerolineae bacterium]